MIEKLIRKSMVIRPSGRSTDFISPSFGYGCLYDCSYCYLKRHKSKGLEVAINTLDILTAINNHSMFAIVDKPNQTHEKFISYDISCNEDFSLHSKYHNWKQIFDFFKHNDLVMGSFATKYVNDKLLDYDSNGKIRIRFSLMPQKFSSILEPKTSKIIDRIKAIDKFIDAGYDVHINFSPVIVTENWLIEYKELFQQVDNLIKSDNKNKVKCEVIFLTHNKQKHEYNLKNKLGGEDLIWNSAIQEDKVSEYGGLNIRYKYDLKREYINQFIQLHDNVIPWNTIRYIF